MDQAPKLPPRPEKKLVNSFYQTNFTSGLNFNHGNNRGCNILDLVPPPAENESSCGNSSNILSKSSPFPTHAIPVSSNVPVPVSPSRIPSSVFDNFQENILYSLSDQSSSERTAIIPSISLPHRPNRIPGLSRSNGQLIDWNSRNNNNQLNIDGNKDDENSRKDKAIQQIKSLINQSNSSTTASPLMSPIGINMTFGNQGMFPPQSSIANLPRNINFMQNPLYSNQLASNGLGTPTNPKIIFSSMLNNNPQSYVNIINACSVVGSGATSPIGFSYFSNSTNHQAQQSSDINEMIISKINNNSQQQQQQHNQQIGDHNNQTEKSVLMPVSVFDAKQYRNSQSVIDLFDPLFENGVNTSPKKIQISSNSNEKGSDDDVHNNNSTKDEIVINEVAQPNNFYQNSNGQSINLLQVEKRDRNFSNDLQEYYEHLRALYLSVCSKSSKLSNCGLVWSPRIETISSVNIENNDTYMCSPAMMRQQSMKLSNSSSSNNSNIEADMSLQTAIFDIRFNSLVHAKLTGLQELANIEFLKSDSVWHSMKLSSTLDNTVEMIITHVSCNVERKNDAPNIDLNDFLLKIHGRNEYLVPKTVLSSYVCVQQFKKMNQDIALELVDKTLPEFWRPFLRTDLDNNHIGLDFKPEQLLPSKLISYYAEDKAGQLNRILENLNIAFVKCLSMTDVQLIIREKSLFKEIEDNIQYLFSCLSYIKTSKLRKAIVHFNNYYNHHINEEGNGPNGGLSLSHFLDQFQIAFCNMLLAFSEVIHLYSITFPVNFELSKNDQPKISTKYEDITEHIERFKMKIDVVAQVPTNWKLLYNSYSLRIIVSHGFKVLDHKYTDRRAIDSDNRLEFDREMAFENTIISELPKEARIDFHLVGIKNSINASKFDVDVLASTFFYLFERENSDEINFFRHGDHLIPMTIMDSSSTFSINSYETLDSYPLSISDSNFIISYDLDPMAPMLVFSIVTNNPHLQYFYPKVTKHQTNRSRPTTLEINRNSFERSSLRLDTPVPLNRSTSNVSNTSSGNTADSLYGFYGRSTDRLDRRNRQQIISIVQRNPLDPINRDEKILIWENRDNLSDFPGAILKILKAPPRWSHSDVKKVCHLLDSFDYFRISENPTNSSPRSRFTSLGSYDASLKLPFCTAIEALQLLSSDYPDLNVRLKAVRWLKTVSTDELCDFLPQLVQSLRYESHYDCPLIWLLFECSLTSSRFCHYFYWQLKSCRKGDNFYSRCKFYRTTLLILCGENVKKMFKRQKLLCSKLEQICVEIKQSKDNMRQSVLKNRLESLHEFLESCPISIPLSPSIQVCGVEISQCSYFNSNSLPLKIVFQAAPPYVISSDLAQSVIPVRTSLISSIYEQKKQLNKVIFKSGDDLRQDMLVMQIISIINRIWIRSNLDLRLITFGVMNNSDRTGMIELVSRARTLRQIQVEHGVTGNFKHHTIANWLRRHNPGEFEYMMAVENFLHSCAGYVVITYLLGICDRHNDNIMVTTFGHLFHIDFGKFLGDAQTMGGIRRDRAPFVFTADMAYVINEGDKPSKNYQFFVDLCCRCFSQVRQNGNFLLSLLSMMIPSGIFGLTPETIKYFHNALMPELTDSQAQAQFYRLMEKALNSYATQLNFFMHTLAQIRFNSSSSQADVQNYAPNTISSMNVPSSTDSTDQTDSHCDPETDLQSLESDTSPCKFSFTSIRFSKESEGYITHLEIVDIWKKYVSNNEKEYYYKIKVDRQNVPECIVYRSFKEFIELYVKLTRTFTLIRFSRLSRSKPTTQDMADQRKVEIQQFLDTLLVNYSQEVSHNDIVYTFFHYIHRDQQFFDEEKGIGPSRRPDSKPAKLKMVINYRDNALHVLVRYARNLETSRNSAPDTYVKLYLKPDPNKNTKRKTRVVPKNANPTYMDSITYEGYKIEELRNKVLEVSVWASDISGNSRIGGHMLSLKELDLSKKIDERWYPIN